MGKKRGLPFDRAGGGVVAIQRRLLASQAYEDLGSHGQALVMFLHLHWSPNGPVGFGVREAQRKLGCSRKVAMRTFRELQEAGFIVLVDESRFCSRTQSKTRTWRLTWMPDWRNQKPTNNWEASA